LNIQAGTQNKICSVYAGERERRIKVAEFVSLCRYSVVVAGFLRKKKLVDSKKIVRLAM
jgi:hypothetical protein